MQVINNRALYSSVLLFIGCVMRTFVVRMLPIAELSQQGISVQLSCLCLYILSTVSCTFKRLTLRRIVHMHVSIASLHIDIGSLNSHNIYMAVYRIESWINSCGNGVFMHSQ